MSWLEEATKMIGLEESQSKAMIAILLSILLSSYWLI